MVNVGLVFEEKVEWRKIMCEEDGRVIWLMVAKLKIDLC